ncbi:MAG: glycoside hydrolase family 2 TIM barrel-domain containing protein, partial [Terriglobia bacterium]
MRDHCRRELRELIARDRNHPALVMWGALNEGAAEGEELKAELAAYAHELDPTRLVFDDSGGVYYSGENTRVDIPGNTSPRAINDIHPYMLQPFSNASFDYYRRMQEPHLLNFTSEFGGMGGIEDLDAVIGSYEPGREWQDKDRLEEIYAIFKKGFNEMGLEQAFGDFAAFARSSRASQAEALTRMIDALRINPLTGGYDICDWNDASFEFPFGLVDEWRNPKPSLAAATEANKPLHIVISTARSNLYAGEPMDVELTIANDDGRTGRAEVNLEIASRDGNSLQKQARLTTLGTRIQPLSRFHLVAPPSEGDFRLRATMDLDGKLLDRTEQNILVLKRLRPRAEVAAEVGVLDPAGRLAGRLSSLSIKTSPYNALAPAQSVYLVPPLADSLYDYPLRQLKGLVELARRGATLVMLELPMDSGEVSEKFGLFPMPLTVSFPEGFKAQWIRAHAMTAGLPSNLVLDQRYAEVLPARFLDMSADEVVGGVLLDAFGDYHRRWYQSLVTKRVDQGHIIICQYRLRDNLGKDPLADRLFVNLLDYAKSISRTPEAPLSREQEEAFSRQISDRRKQVQGEIQRWAVVGPFENPGRAGLDREYPPEKEFRMDQSYPGKNGSVNWKPVTVWQADGYSLGMGTRFDDWTVHYAYTQLYSPKQVEAQFKLTCQQGCRLWLKGKEIIYSAVSGPNENTLVPVTLYAGWNRVLVKVDRTKMQHSFLVLNVQSKSGEAMRGLIYDFAGQPAGANPPGKSRLSLK